MSENAVQTPPENRSRTPLMLAAVAAAAVVAALVGYFLVVPLFAADPTATSSAVTTPNAAVVVPTATPTPSATVAPKEFQGTVGRDPFKIQVPTGGSTPAAGATGATVAPSTAATTAATAPATTPTFVDVLVVERAQDGPAVTLRLDTALHIAGAGETIDGVLKITAVTLRGECATFQYGDESFRLCADDPARRLG
jgi:hypothetical protein